MPCLLQLALHTALILCTPSPHSPGQNAIVIVSGANLLLTEAEVAAAEEVIAGAKVMVCQLEVKPEVTLCALQLGKKHGGVCVSVRACGFSCYVHLRDY